MRCDSGLAVASLILSIAVALDWLAGNYLHTPFVARCGMLGLAIIMSGVAVVTVMKRNQRAANLVRKYLVLLTKADAVTTTAAELDELKLDGAWNDLCRQLYEKVQTLSARTAELEQSHAALEIRARRQESHAQRVEAILAGLPEPVLAINDYDELILSNPSANRLLEIEADSTEDRALAHLVQCERLVELLTETRKRRGGVQRCTEVELLDEEGAPRWFSATARPLRALNTTDDSGRSAGAGAVAVLRDISQQKAAQRRNAEFVSAVSHEMKTPLAGIKAYTELLVDGDADDDETREECLGVITSQANRLQRLVENLLNLARIEAGVVSVSKHARPLNELLDEALELVRPSAEAKQITVTRDLSPMYLGVFVDRDMMLQTAINLLSNAIKYTPTGGKVTLRSRLVDTEVWFEVEDTGVGLSPEDCGKVFEKFYRVHNSKDMAAGTGLGLPLAKHIVEDVHGGRLSVDSTLGKGSTFRVALPNAGQLSPAT